MEEISDYHADQSLACHATPPKAALYHYPMKSFRSEKILIWNSGTQEQTFFSLPDFLISKLHHWLRLCRAVVSLSHRMGEGRGEGSADSRVRAFALPSDGMAGVRVES